MGKLTREDLEPLRILLAELSEFVKNLYIEENPYFMKFIENMKNNLEICVLIRYEGWEKMEQLLRRDWNFANQGIIGIPSFDIAVNDPKRKEELSGYFLELILGIEYYLY